MKDSFVSAKAVNLTTIKILFFTSLPMPRNFCPSLIVDDGRHFPLKIVKQISLNNLFYFDCETKEELQLGHHYDVACYDFGIVPVNLSDLSSLEGFDKKYYYDGDDLGATIKSGKTSFVVWTPLSSKVLLNYFYKGDWHTKEMVREKSGVYRLVFDENLGGAKYYYYLDNGSKFVRVTDPYAKGSTANGEESVVIDFDSIGIDLEEKDLPTYKSYTETIIYEAHVRDLTIDPNTNITFKGTYAGLCETGKTTKMGHPAGIDYIKYLGITHIQLLPIYDYKSVDELNPLKGYNWGYDP